MFEVKKRDGTIVKFDMKNITNSILKAVKESEKKEKREQLLNETQIFLTIYGELEKQEQINVLSQTTTDELSQAYKAIIKMLQNPMCFTGDDWLNDYYNMFALTLKFQIQKELRKRWKKNRTLKVLAIQFRQYVQTIISKSSKLLASPSLSLTLNIIKMVIVIKTFLPKKQQKKAL